MAANPFVIVQHPKPPCSTCEAECCSPVPIMRREYQAILKVLKGKSQSEIERLAKQQREINRCMFVDMEKFNCSVYSARPTICRLFSRHPQGICTHCPEAARELTAMEAGVEMQVAIHASQGEVVGISGLTTYPNVAKVSSDVITWRQVKKDLAA